jgi:hypothetical protein
MFSHRNAIAPIKKNRNTNSAIQCHMLSEPIASAPQGDYQCGRIERRELICSKEKFLGLPKETAQLRCQYLEIIFVSRIRFPTGTATCV